MGKLAITGGDKTRINTFPDYPYISEEDKKYILNALESGRWARTAQDSNTTCKLNSGYIEKLELCFSKMQKTKYALAVSSGTAALEIALQTIGLEKGDEVIVTPYTFISSVSCILKIGGKPIFADIDEATWNISPKSIEDCISKKTRAIVLVHFAGQLVDFNAIHNIAKTYNLILISDAAHAINSKWNEKTPGQLSDICCFSLQSSKNLTCGEGGILVTNKKDYYEKAYSIHMCGRKFNGKWYEYSTLGSNYRMTEFQAAVAVAQLKSNNKYEQIRYKNAIYLIDKMKDIEGIEPTRTLWQARMRDYHLFTFSYNKEYFQGLSRKRFILALNCEGIPCDEGYGSPLYRVPILPQTGNNECPITEIICKQAVWIHQNVLLGTYEDMDDIILGIKKIQTYCYEISN